MEKKEKKSVKKALEILLLLIMVTINILLDDIKIICILTIFLIIINFFYNKHIIKNLKTIKILLIFYISIFIFHVVLNQNGEVLYQISNFYITKEGIMQGLLNFIRIMNLLLLSWIGTFLNIFENKMGSYTRVVENVISLIPEVFNLFKKRMKIKWFIRYIMKQIKNKN